MADPLTTSTPFAAISLITICSGRQEHLYRLIEGVLGNTLFPQELIVVSNDELQLPSSLAGIKLQVIRHQTNSSGFHIGKARNLGASVATCSRLFFLDVDCIPAANYIFELNATLDQCGGLVMGNPRYLTQKFSMMPDKDELEKLSIAHPQRPTLAPGKPLRTEDYGLFWSLCFGVSRSDFSRIGGFDEQFAGYGGEDTDLAFTARERELPFHLCDANVFHQQHTVYSPPVNHFHSIIDNCRKFYKKWRHWPMSGWLESFRKLDLIEWTGQNSHYIKVLATPSYQVLQRAKKEHAPFI